MTRRFVGFGGSAGGGSGTVTNTGGNLTANAVVLGAGGADTKVSTGITTNGASELDLGVAGTSGVLGLNGLTSGKATLTAPAVAGTSTNPIVSTNALQLPVGAAATPSLTFTGHVSSGLFYTSAHGITMVDSSTPMAVFDSNQGVVVADGNGLLFSPNVDGSSADTALSREAANILSIGAAEAGFSRSAGSGRVTADISLTVNTAITIFSFSLPAIAKPWAWQAVIPWVCSAATGTPTLSIGVNYTQTPTGTTGMQAEILTTNTGTGTQAYVALSATGATNILTTGTLTPAATVFQSTCSGTLLASATAGTFTITITLTATTTTALAKAGATCWFY
jgi:hypothetical protein